LTIGKNVTETGKHVIDFGKIINESVGKESWHSQGIT